MHWQAFLFLCSHSPRLDVVQEVLHGLSRRVLINLREPDLGDTADQGMVWLGVIHILRNQ